MKKAWVYFTTANGHKVKIDKEDLSRVEQHSWRVTYGTTGRARVVTSIRKPEGVRSVTLGRFLVKAPKGKQIYPRRFNEGLDYRKENLVVVSIAERQRLLSKRRADTTSIYKGVSYSKTDDKWRAGIEVDEKAINLGHFESEEEAALAYNKAAKKYFGEIAYQNQIQKSSKRKSDSKKKKTKK